MSVYAAFDGVMSDQIGSNTGWGDFGRWVDGLDSDAYAQLAHLREYGWCQNLPQLERELAGAAKDYPPDGPTLQITQGVLSLLRDRGDAEVMTATDGLGPMGDDKHSEVAVPPMRQQTKYSCGAAALRSVLARFGSDWTEPELRELLGTDPEDGTDPDAILRVARDHGLQADPQEHMTMLQLARAIAAGRPVLVPLQAYGTDKQYAANESGHWAVATGWDGFKVTFADPASEGETYLPAREFLDRWHDQDADGKVYRRYGIIVSQ